MRNLMPLLVLMLPALLQASSLSAVPATQTASANAATLLSVARAGSEPLPSAITAWCCCRMITVGISIKRHPCRWPPSDGGVLRRCPSGLGRWSLGAILATTDGGDTWQVQRLSSAEDRPLFAVHFFNPQQGVAVGLWSLVLTTDDGGKHWTEQRLEAPPGSKRADLNLMGLFADGEGCLYATAERGQLLRSDDQGKHWRYVDTGYSGTLWTGAVLGDGSLLVGGQRGTLLHGSADGARWQRVSLQSKSSVTAIDVSGQTVIAVGLDGLIVRSDDGGQSFHEQPSGDGVSLTATLLNGDGSPIVFSRRGVVSRH